MLIYNQTHACKQRSRDAQAAPQLDSWSHVIKNKSNLPQIYTRLSKTHLRMKKKSHLMCFLFNFECLTFNFSCRVVALVKTWLSVLHLSLHMSPYLWLCLLLNWHLIILNCLHVTKRVKITRHTWSTHAHSNSSSWKQAVDSRKWGTTAKPDTGSVWPPSHGGNWGWTLRILQTWASGSDKKSKGTFHYCIFLFVKNMFVSLSLWLFYISFKRWKKTTCLP